MNNRVILGMSGGVDSSVSALLLKNKGYEVIGVTFNLTPDYTGVDDFIKDAKNIALKLGIEHHVVDLRSQFENKVIFPFLEAYGKGKTPNPCVTCNKFIKFGIFYKMLTKYNCDKIATGHYARNFYDEDRKRYVLMRGIDKKKDQSYFIYNVTQEVLSKTLFPLGDLTKTEVREIAETEGFNVAHKKDSEEICFIKNNDYGSFIEKMRPEIVKKGNFIDEKGNVLGVHKGITYYTPGQRKGLGIAMGERMFVKKITSSGDIVLAKDDSLYYKQVLIDNVNMVSYQDIDEDKVYTAKIRYGTKENEVVLKKMDNKLLLNFETAVRAPAKGQSAVVYNGDSVVCGGIIIGFGEEI